MPYADEASLIERARAFDKKAISQLYQSHVQSIYKYIYVRVNDTHTAEDLTSEVFLRALEGLQTFEYRGIPFAAWLFRIARDRVIDYYRKQSRQQNTATLTESLLSDDDEPHDAVLRDLDEQELREALEALTEDQRLVIILRFIDCEPLTEVACKLGKTEGAIKSLQHRALAALGRILEGKRC